MTTTISTAPPTPAGPDCTVPRDHHGHWLAFAILLAGTAVLYLWNLDINGWANDYYAAAVQAMAQNWTAFLFGSLDPGNVITIDKPPASLWVMALSVRLFGLSPWSVLVPQALMGVVSVALLYAGIRRVAGPVAALVGGAMFALTPVAVLMFRFNNPDALLVLLLVAAAYATLRAVERAGTRWLALAGGLIGLAFLTKMAQAFLVLPALTLTYLVAARTSLLRRVWQLLLANITMIVSGGWWYALVELWPADRRPYIGGSRTNSVVELAVGYNGLQRIVSPGGRPAGGGPVVLGPGAAVDAAAPSGPEISGPGSGPGFGGPAGPLRLFEQVVGGQVSWLLPAALVLLLAGLWFTRRAPRTDLVRAALLLWGGWMVVTGLVFSLMSGIFHEYYTVALAPAVAALVAIGGRVVWAHRHSWAARVILAGVTVATGVWAWVLLARTPDFLPWLRWAVVVAAIAVGGALLAPGQHGRGLVTVGVVLVALAGPVAYALPTAATSHVGTVPSAGPPTLGREGPKPIASLRGAPPPVRRGAPPQDEVDPGLVAMLRTAGTKWAAATVGAQTGARLQLSSGVPVMSIGGFNGSDPAPTLAKFQEMVAAGEVRYFVVGGFGPRGGPWGPRRVPDRPSAVAASTPGRGALGVPGPRRPSPGADIEQWVSMHFTARTVAGMTVYDLSAPKSQ